MTVGRFSFIMVAVRMYSERNGRNEDRNYRRRSRRVLMAACTLCDLGEQRVLFERNDRVGRKLAHARGKGRCNLTNSVRMYETVLENIPTNKRFPLRGVASFTPFDVMAYFEDTLGLPLKTEQGKSGVSPVG